MKIKNIKLMLLGLLAFGSSNAFAQKNLYDIFPVDNYVYEVTKLGVANGKAGEVKIVGVYNTKNPVVDKKLEIPATISSKVFDDTYSFAVTEFYGNALRIYVDAAGAYVSSFPGMVNAESVEFSKYIKEIPANALDGYTNLNAVSFEAGSNLVTVNNYAFATTQISTFDFSNCKKLAGLDDEVFVEYGKINSYITEVTLPGTTLFKTIGAAFRNLTSLTKIHGLENSSVTKIVTDAFSGDTKLNELTLPNTVQTIEDYAFRNTGIETLTIDVTALEKLGEGNEVYGTTVAQKVLKSLKLHGNLGGVIGANAFKGMTTLETLDLSELNFASKGQIATSAFEGCNNAKFKTLTLGNILDQPTAGYTIAKNAFKDCSKLETFTLGYINSANAIEDDAFTGCTALHTVTIGNITAAANSIKGGAFNTNCTNLATVTIGNINGSGIIGDGTNPVFGNKLKTVTIGTVKAGAAAILGGAFVYADVSNATLSLATGAGEYVSSDDAFTAVIATNAFDFSAVVNAGAAAGFVFPVVNIGEIRSQGGAFAGGALTGDNIAVINFKGNIAKDGLRNKFTTPTTPSDPIIQDSDKDLSVDDLAYLKTLNFDGTIGTGGIAIGAFANMPQIMTITFNGELAEFAIAQGAFKDLPAGSKVEYKKVELTDATVNPFDKWAFIDQTTDFTPDAVIADTDLDGVLSIEEIDAYFVRDIDITVANEDLYKAFDDNAFEGLRTDGIFDIYRVKFWKAPDPIVDYNKFYVYQDGTSTTAWARFWGSTWDDLQGIGTLPDKKIARYQTVDGGAKVKLTLYGTYTDDPGADNDDPAIYMVPLKAIDGYYEIAKTTNEAIIVKAEIINGGSFADKDIELSFTPTILNNSWWGYGGAATLHNADLFINPAIVTNQQLIDHTSWVDIYDGGTPGVDPIAYDLYVMNNPAKYKGFRVDKNVISKEKKTYIGEGWWCMLLRKTTAAAAKVIWMDDAEATGIFDVKNDVKEKIADNAIYTLQGVRVSEPQKGQIYIMNGKKYIAK